MSRIFLVAVCLSFFVGCTGKKTYTEQLVDALAVAYAEFEVTDKLPETIVVGNDTCDKRTYYEAVCRLLINISKGVTDEIALTGFATASYPATLDTFVEDEIPIELLVDYSQRQLSYTASKDTFANYVLYPHNFIGPDGETYNGQLSFDRSAVILARVFAYYLNQGKLPARLSSWHSDFLHSTLNCDIFDDVVTSTLDSITAGKTTVRQKAEAMFYHVRDHVKYDYYYDTKHGASATLTGKTGNCCDTSHSLVAMARAAGIPARYVHANATYPSGKTYGHVWMEMYVDDNWHLCDATGKKNTFGNHENWTTCELRAKYVELYF